MAHLEKEKIVLADCEIDEVKSFAKALSEDSSPFLIKSHISNFKRTGKLSEIKRYAIYFSVGFKYFLVRKKYSTIMGWQQFYALIYCFFCSIFCVKKQNTVVALNFTYKEKKGKAKKIYKWFMSKCLDKKYLDYIHVPSYEYAQSVSQEFDFPKERILVTSFGIDDAYDSLSKTDAPNGLTKEGYALAIGRSNRDYDFLIKAWRSVDYPLVIISDTYKGDAQKNENITILTNVTNQQSYPYIANCSLMIIPIDEPNICSGDTVLLTAMMLKRKIIVTVPSTLAEMYVNEQENALLTQKEEKEFVSIVKKALHDEKYSDLGEKARQSFLCNFSRQSMGRKTSDFINNNN